MAGNFQTHGFVDPSCCEIIHIETYQDQQAGKIFFNTADYFGHQSDPVLYGSPIFVSPVVAVRG